MESPVLMQVSLEKLPPPEVACRQCRFAAWMEFKHEVKCYCSVTHAWMYVTDQPAAMLVLACDSQINPE